MQEIQDGWEGTGTHELHAEGCSFLHSPAGSCRVHITLKLFPDTPAMLEDKSCFQHEWDSRAGHVKGRPGQGARGALARKTNSPSLEPAQPFLLPSSFTPIAFMVFGVNHLRRDGRERGDGRKEKEDLRPSQPRQTPGIRLGRAEGAKAWALGASSSTRSLCTGSHDSVRLSTEVDCRFPTCPQLGPGKHSWWTGSGWAAGWRGRWQRKREADMARWRRDGHRGRPLLSLPQGRSFLQPHAFPDSGGRTASHVAWVEGHDRSRPLPGWPTTA